MNPHALAHRPPQHHADRPLAAALGLLLLPALLALAGPARADKMPAPQLPAYQQDCASCHMAYPPGLLPAASWRRLMGGLDRHFGSDASVDAATQKTLAAWLDTHAGTFKKVARNPTPPRDDRITQAAWFQGEHREISAAVFKRASIHSASNCVACHSGAAQGRFGEHEIQIPQ